MRPDQRLKTAPVHYSMITIPNRSADCALFNKVTNKLIVLEMYTDRILMYDQMYEYNLQDSGIIDSE